MNTTTLSETTAVAEAVPAHLAPASLAVAAGSAAPPHRLLRLSNLRPSRSRNVRPKVTTSITELAASILRVGLLHNLVVVLDEDGEHGEVVAGRRRLAALKLLVKQRKLSKGAEVSCLPVPEAAGRTASLTENVQREAMHPADQFEAFSALVREGRPIEDIAADFGVSPLVVRRRLRLANLSPRLLTAYRADEVSLEQLMALSITDDPALQEAAFFGQPEWRRSAGQLRSHLTRDEVTAQDPVARFVGFEAYEAAGGAVRRDLFSEQQDDAYLGDPALLDRLAGERLAELAESVRTEGWGWVEVAPRTTIADLHRFGRAAREHRVPSRSEARKADQLRRELSKLQDRLDAGDLPVNESENLQARAETLESELERQEESLTVFAPEVMAEAGAVVAVDRTGAAVVHRGLLSGEVVERMRLHGRHRAEQGEAEATSSTSGEEGDDGVRAGATLSERLVRRLSAHRTAALQAEVARHPRVALVALVHHFALRLIVECYDGSPIDIHPRCRVDGLAEHAPDLPEAPAAQGLLQVRQAWAERLPDDPVALFEVLLAMEQDELLGLLAVCVASTVIAVASRESERPAVLLAQAVGLDMHAWWTPTADGYFAHVSKAKTLEAVAVFAPSHAARLSKCKKGDLAGEAERLAMGTGWLPAMFQSATATLNAEAEKAQRAGS